MKYLKILLILLVMNVGFFDANGQCNHTLVINSYSATCNGTGTSTVDINVTVLFGNGNNSATIQYNIGSGDVNAMVLEDNDGDIIDMDYSFGVPGCDNFDVILKAWTNPSGSGSSCTDPAPVVASVVLPVTFGYFNVSGKGKNVSLEWSTHSETNNDFFEILKSNDNSNFVSIGKVSGAGNSNREIDYQFTDEALSRGTYYYKIKQVDLDGQFSFSEVRSLQFNGDSKLEVYPNPAQNYIHIKSLERENVVILDGLGRVVSVSQNKSENDRIDISSLEPGMYFITASQHSESIPFVKTK